MSDCSTLRPFGPERLDLSSSTSLKAEGLSTGCEMAQILLSYTIILSVKICKNKKGLFAPPIYLCNKTLSHLIPDEEA